MTLSVISRPPIDAALTVACHMQRLSAKQIGYRGCRTTIGNVNHVDAGHHLRKRDSNSPGKSKKHPRMIGPVQRHGWVAGMWLLV
jgi:hypothetical protein